MWVGLGGFSGINPFDQAGIEVRCPASGGNPIFLVFREFISGVYPLNALPGAEQPAYWTGLSADQQPRAGDDIVATVTETNGVYHVSVQNKTRGLTLPDSRAVPYCVNKIVGLVPICI